MLGAEGTWRWRGATGGGRFAVAAIRPGDWARWGVNPATYNYNPVPTRKIVMYGWNGAPANRVGGDGPVEARSDGRVDFFWVDYRTTASKSSRPGMVHTKFGHAPGR